MRSTVVVISKPNQNLQNELISLLSVLSKAFERTLLQRLQTAVNESHAISDEQYRFRAKHGTMHQLTRLVEFTTDGFNRNQSTGAIFLDVRKAFDRVCHEGLMYKLH